jgi:hypothetical protein
MCHNIYVLSRHVLPYPFDDPIALFGGIISPHGSSKISVKSDLWTLRHQKILFVFISHYTSNLLCQVMGLGAYL